MQSVRRITFGLTLTGSRLGTGNSWASATASTRTTILAPALSSGPRIKCSLLRAETRNWISRWSWRRLLWKTSISSSGNSIPTSISIRESSTRPSGFHRKCSPFCSPFRGPWDLARWEEMLQDPQQKIARLRQIYTGHDARDFVPIEKRGLHTPVATGNQELPEEAAVETRGCP